MDPVTILGAVGSVVGIAAFGLQLSQFVNDFLGEYERANESLQDVCYGLEGTIAVLEQIDELLHWEKENRASKSGKPKLFSDKALADVRKNTDGCLKVFWKIEATILSVKENPKELEERIKLKLQDFHETVKRNQEEGKEVRHIIHLERRRNLNRVQKFMYSFSTVKQLARYRDQLNYFQQSLSLLFHIVQLGIHLKAPKTPVRNFDLLHTRENINLTVVERRHAKEKLSDQDDDFAFTAEPPSYQTYDLDKRGHKIRKELHQGRVGEERAPRRRLKIPDSQDFRPLRSPASSTEDTQRGRTEKRGTYINRSGNEYFYTESNSPENRSKRNMQERSSSESAGSPVDYKMKAAQRHMEENLKRNLKKKPRSKRATDLDPRLANESKKYPEMPFSQSPTRMDDDELQSMLPQRGSVTNSPVIERQKQEVTLLKIPVAKAPTKYQKPSVTDQLPEAIEDEISDFEEVSKNLNVTSHSKPRSPPPEVLNTWPGEESILLPVVRPTDFEVDPHPRVETALLDDPIPGGEQALLVDPTKVQLSDGSNQNDGNGIKTHISTEPAQLLNDSVSASLFQTQPISPEEKQEQEGQTLQNSGLYIKPQTIEVPLGVDATRPPENSTRILDSATEDRLDAGKESTKPTSQKEILFSVQPMPGAWVEDEEENFSQHYFEPTNPTTAIHMEGEEKTDTPDKKTPENEARKVSHNSTGLDQHKETVLTACEDPGKPRIVSDSPKPNTQRNSSPKHPVSKAETEMISRQEHHTKLSSVMEKSKPQIVINTQKPLDFDTSTAETSVGQIDIKKSVESPVVRPELRLTPLAKTPILLSNQQNELVTNSEQYPLSLPIQEDYDYIVASNIEASPQKAKQKGKGRDSDEQLAPTLPPMSPIAPLALEVTPNEETIPGRTRDGALEIKNRKNMEPSKASGSSVREKANEMENAIKFEDTGNDKVTQPAAQQIHITLSGVESPTQLDQRYPRETLLENQGQAPEFKQPIDVFQFLVPDDEDGLRRPKGHRTLEKFEGPSDIDIELETSTNSTVSGSSKSERRPNIFRGFRRIQGRAFVTQTNMEDIFGPGTFLTAFVIRGKDYHQIPCPGHFSLRQGDLENSQSSGPISWKKFAFLTSDEMWALSQILSSDENEKYRGSLVHLKWLRKEKLKFWSNENRSLVAIIQNHKAEAPMAPRSKLESSGSANGGIVSPSLEQLPQPTAERENTNNNSLTKEENIETFVIYAAFTVRVLEPQNEYGDHSLVPPTTEREGFSEADILQRITELKSDGPHVIEKKLKLLKTQQTEIAKIISDMNMVECEPGFVWNVAQLEAIDGQSTGLRSVTVYLRKTPIGVEVIIMEETYRAPDHDKTIPEPSPLVTPISIKTVDTVEIPRKLSPLAPPPSSLPAKLADEVGAPPKSISPTLDTGRTPHERRTRRRSITESATSSTSRTSTWSALSPTYFSPQPAERRRKGPSIYNPRPYIPESSIGNSSAWRGTRYESHPNPFKSENRSIYFPDSQAQYPPPFQPAYQPPSANYWAPPAPLAPSAPPAAPEIPERRAHFADDEEKWPRKSMATSAGLRHSIGGNQNGIDQKKTWETRRPPSVRSSGYETGPYAPSTSHPTNGYEPSQSSRSYLGRPALPDLEPVRNGSIASTTGPLKRRSHLPYPSTFDSRSFRLKPTQSEVLQEDTKLVRGLLLEWVPSGDEDEEEDEKEKL